LYKLAKFDEALENIDYALNLYPQNLELVNLKKRISDELASENSKK